MPRIPMSLGLGSYESISVPFSAQRCINMYAGIAQEQALNDYALFKTPGIKAFATVADKPSRGAVVMGGVYYVILGQELYSVDSLGADTLIGTIAGTKRVSMAHNGTKLAIVTPGESGLNCYVYNATTDVLVQVSDTDFLNASSVCFKDGYYIFTKTDSNIFFISALNDPLTYDALDFGTAELAPGNITGCHVNHDELYIFKREITEVFQNIGGSGFPFQRIPGASYEKGSHSKYSPIQWGGKFYFVGGGANEKTGVFAAAGAAEPYRISTDAIENEIQKFTDTEIGNSYSFTYSISGSSFVGFTFRSVNITPRTFVYNITASELKGRNIWFEQQSGVDENAWRVESVDYVYSKLLVSDTTDGRIGELDPDTNTDYSEVILREKTTGPLTSQGESLFVQSMELVVDAGKGLITGQGSDPEIMMSFSDDGARTFQGQFTRKLGKIGQYFRRVEWRRLGRIPYNRVWKFTVSDPIDITLIKLEAVVTGER